MEKDSTERHEYHEGEIVSMAGGTPIHSRIISNIIREAGIRLKGSDCGVFESNLRVRIPNSRLYAYPDATIVCGEVEIDPDDPSKLTIINPRVIVEVLSPTTEQYDYGIKFRRYIGANSLREYVIVAQDRPEVQTYFRRDDGTWLFTPVAGMDQSFLMRAVNVEIPLSETYAGVTFQAGDM